MTTQPRLVRDLAIAAAYFCAAAIVVASTRFHGSVAMVWVAGAILIAELSIRSRQDWSRLLILCGAASVIATGLFGLGWRLAGPFAAINLAEAAIAASVLQHRRKAKAPLGSITWLWQFISSVGIVAPLVAGLGASLVLRAATGAPFVETYRDFVVGHALGNLTFVPLLSLALGGHFRERFRSLGSTRRSETVFLLGLVAFTTAFAFGTDGLPLLFLPLGPIVLVMFRGREVGAVIAIVILAVGGGALTIAGHGPIGLIHGTAAFRAQFFQFYLASVVLTVLPVAGDLRLRARLHRALRESEERYRLIAEHSTDIVMHTELDGTIRYVSPAIEQLGGYRADELVGQSPQALVVREHWPHIADRHVATLAARGDTLIFEYEAVTKGGDRRWFETHSRALIDQNERPEGMLSFIRDITVRKATETRLAAEAATDPLTGLPNLRSFRDQIGAIAVDRRYWQTALAIIDIDHFKSVNDCFGHAIGDEVLKSFARIARRMLRRQDVLARIGGEEFAIIFPGLDDRDAAIVCDRIRERIAADPCESSLGPIAITISGGVALLGEDGLDAAMKRADAALYGAKRAGRDRLMLAA